MMGMLKHPLQTLSPRFHPPYLQGRHKQILEGLPHILLYKSTKDWGAKAAPGPPVPPTLLTGWAEINFRWECFSN